MRRFLVDPAWFGLPDPSARAGEPTPEREVRGRVRISTYFKNVAISDAVRRPRRLNPQVMQWRTRSRSKNIQRTST